MAEKRVGNRSSEGVVAIRHPRTDFPQMGWLSKATITFYEPNSGFGWFSETQSYLPNANINGYRTRKRSVRPFYQTEPQQGWLNKPVNLNLYEANSGFGWFSETQSFRPDQTKLRYGAKSRSKVLQFYQTQPGDVYDPSVLARLHTSWVIPSERLRPHPARDLDRWDQDDANFDVVNFTAAFDPSLLNWQIPSARIPNHPARDLDRWDQDDANFDVVNFAQAFDPATQDWHIDSALTSKRLGRFLRETVPDNAWMGDHAQLNAWGIPADRMRLGLRYQRDTNTDVSWIFPTLPVFDPVNFNWTQQTEQTQGGKTYQRDTNPDTSWMFPNLPAAFDPSTQNWTIDSPRTSKSLGRFIRETLFDNVWMGNQQAWPIPSDRMVPGPRYRWDTNIDISWLFTNLPAVFDPAIQNWVQQTDTYRSRKWWSDSPIPQAWMVPAVIYDPTLWPGTTIDSQRLWLKTRGRWQPDLDNAWAQFSVANKVWTISGQTQTCAGAVLGNCVVLLFRTSDNVIIGTTTSDVAGNYSFTVSDGTTAYFLVSYHANVPDVTGATLNTIVGS